MTGKTLKALFLLLCSAGALLTAAGIGVQLMASREGYTGTVISGSFEFEEPRELVAVTVSMPIIVQYGDTDKVKVSYTGGLPLIFSEEKGVLRITQDDSFSMNIFSLRAYGSRAEITLPHKIYKRISLSSSGGYIEAYSLGADRLDVSTKGGDIRLYNIDERTSIRTESGRINAVFSSLGSDMTINAGSGDVELELPEDIPFNLEFLTESGSFSSSRFKEKYYNKFGDTAILDGDIKNLLTVNTTSGDLLIYD